MKRLNKKGFSMIELLVVLLIIGILAAVAAPLFIQNSTKAIVSEAVAGAGAIRSGERTYDSQYGGYLAITDGALYFGTGTDNDSSVLGVQIHGNKYFSPDAYTVSTTATTWDGAPSGVTLSAPVDFIITVTGSASKSLSGDTDGAASNTVVNSYEIQMDNSGQTIYTTDGKTWSKFS